MLAGTLVAVPLALAPGLEFFDVTPKMLALLLGAGAVWLLLANQERWPRLRRSHRAFLLLLGGLAGAGILATVFSQDRVLSVVGAEWRRLGLPAWLACLALAAAIPIAAGEDSSRRRRLLAAMVLAALVSAIYSFAQYLGHDPWINPALYHIGEGEWQIVRPPGTLGYVSYFAAFVLMAMFAAAGLAFSASRKGTKVAWGMAATALALAVVISGSRGAWLGAIAGAAALVARLPRRRTALAGVLAVTALAALFVLSPAGQRVRSRLRWFVEDPAGGARLLLWRDSLRLAAAHPLLGAGPEVFGLAFPAFQSLELAQQLPDNYVESPHNIFLDYLSSAGLPAALLFAALMAMALWNLAGSSASRTPLDAALLAALVAGLVAAQFIADTIPTRLALLALAALSLPADLEPGRAGLSLRLAIAWMAVAGLVLALAFGVRLVRADRAAFRASQAVARRDMDVLLAAGRAAHQAFPWTGTYAFRHSRLLGRLVMSPNLPPVQRGLLLFLAEDAGRAALLHSDRPEMVEVHLASLYALQGKGRETQQALEAAIRAAPAWYRPRWLLAVLLFEQGRRREAAEQAGAALERGARKHPDIAARCLGIQRASLGH